LIFQSAALTEAQLMAVFHRFSRYITSGRSAAITHIYGQACLMKLTPTALVTGGSKRIGAAIVADLAAHGFLVAIHCNGSTAEAEALGRSVSAAGGRAAVVSADLTRMEDVRRLLPAANKSFGPVSLLVNNASVFEDDAADALDETVFDRHFALHVKAPSFLAQDFAAQLPDGDEGLIVNIIDERVWKLTPRFYSYTLSKAALWTATRTMAQTFAPRIRVNAIGPGPTLPNSRQSEGDFQRQSAGLLLGKGPDLAEFGATIRYLWGAKSVTGQMIALDGGQHLAWETKDLAGIVE
jgi:NAD(P)-dependent dehydrogenase (short-subunit alcohol dehydrogenase family)